jgi:hypothetical protein
MCRVCYGYEHNPLQVPRQRIKRDINHNQSFAMTDQPKTLSVPDAGRQYFGLGRNASYDAARRGEIPVIKIGSRLRVPVIGLERMLEQASTAESSS